MRFTRIKWVILITTKKGAGGKTKYEAGYSAGISNISRRIKLMNTEQYFVNAQEAANEGKTPGAADLDVNGTWSDTKNTDWQKELAARLPAGAGITPPFPEVPTEPGYY